VNRVIQTYGCFNFCTDLTKFSTNKLYFFHSCSAVAVPVPLRGRRPKNAPVPPDQPRRDNHQRRLQRGRHPRRPPATVKQPSAAAPPRPPAGPPTHGGATSTACPSSRGTRPLRGPRRHHAPPPPPHPARAHHSLQRACGPPRFPTPPRPTVRVSGRLTNSPPPGSPVAPAPRTGGAGGARRARGRRRARRRAAAARRRRKSLQAGREEIPFRVSSLHKA